LWRIPSIFFSYYNHHHTTPHLAHKPSVGRDSSTSNNHKYCKTKNDEGTKRYHKRRTKNIDLLHQTIIVVLEEGTTTLAYTTTDILQTTTMATTTPAATAITPYSYLKYSRSIQHKHNDYIDDDEPRKTMTT